jgi:hypothetical protein
MTVALAALGAVAVFLSGPASARPGTLGSTSTTRTLPYRYVFDSGSQAAAVVAGGWNLIDVDSRARADALPPGARALIWVGDYDNTSCGWQIPDAALVREITGMRGDPKIAGYFYSDEPDPFACPQAPAQHRSRAALIHKLDPAKFTVMVMDSNSGQTSLRQVALWKGAADYIGLNPYVCYRDKACDFGWIDTLIRAADRAGFRYWGAVQAFEDKDWRWPTPAEEQRMLAKWSASHASGYMTFAWTWDGNALSTQSGLLDVFKRFNSPGPTKKRRTSGVPVTRGRGIAAEIHYTYTGAGSVAFDWKGTATTIRYGLTAKYGRKAVAHPARPTPFSSTGPFYEVQLAGLRPGTTYHYAIGAGKDHAFSTAPVGPFRFDVEADVGDSGSSDGVAPTQRQIAADRPAFVLVPGDLTYGNDDGQRAVDRHFNDVMAWSSNAAYMPAWGNHEWDSSGDDLRNYKGRFAIPHPQASPDAPTGGCCGEDWGWFDAGAVRFISYPEPYSDATWQDWGRAAAPIMAAAQANPKISFIVTFGHRPAYSTGYHSGASELASVIGSLSSRYSKYVLNVNGHSHDYERFRPIDGVVHITTGGGGLALEPWGASPDPRAAIRVLHFQHLRVDVDRTQIRIQAVCGPPASAEDESCRLGQVIDSTTIRARG